MCWCVGPCPLMGTVFQLWDREWRRAASEYHSSCHKVQLFAPSFYVQFCIVRKPFLTKISLSPCPDCENLIRKMLVVDPAKRISVAQIKQHRWMLADPSAPHQILSLSLTDYNSNLGDYSEPVLSIMQTLGIDRQRTVEVRKGADTVETCVSVYVTNSTGLVISSRERCVYQSKG